MTHTSPQDERRRSLAVQASKEMDGEKLMILVEQLCSAFDERNNPPQSERCQNRSDGEAKARLSL